MAGGGISYQNTLHAVPVILMPCYTPLIHGLMVTHMVIASMSSYKDCSYLNPIAIMYLENHGSCNIDSCLEGLIAFSQPVFSRSC